MEFTAAGQSGILTLHSQLSAAKRTSTGNHLRFAAAKVQHFSELTHFFPAFFC